MDDRSVPDAVADRHVHIADSQGVNIGDGPQINLFLRPHPPGPVVTGNVPQIPPAFQPREDLLIRLRAAGPGVSVVRAVTGMRGVGKTQLAAAYARECIDAGWRLVAWVNAEDTSSILSELAVIADRMGISEPGTSLEIAAGQVRNHLEADGDRCLLVYDNVTDPEVVFAYLPAAGRSQVVVTSSQAIAFNLGRLTQVDVFTEDESLDFLAERTGLDDQIGARELGEELGHLPLALAQAAAVVRAQRLSYLVYLGRLRSYPIQRYLHPAEGDPYPHGVAEAILLSLDATTANDPTGLCGDLLNVIALLSSSGTSRQILYCGESSDVFMADEAAIDEALAHLADASLLTFSGDGSTVTAHRLVMRVMRERAAHDGDLSRLADKSCRLLGVYAESLGDNWQRRDDARNFVHQVAALCGNLTNQHAEESCQGRLLFLRCFSLGWINRLGDNQSQAIEIGRKLVSDWEQSGGAFHRGTLASKYELATAYRDSGRAAEAIPLFEQVVPAFMRLPGVEYTDILNSINGLALAYEDIGRREHAIGYFELGLAESERLLGDHHSMTIMARSNLAAAYNSLGRAGDAIPLLERAAMQAEMTLGDRHPDTQAVRFNLAHAYRDVGRLDDAISLAERVVSECESKLGADHEKTLKAKFALFGLYWVGGRRDEATKLLKGVATGYARNLGAEHPDTITVCMVLSRVNEISDSGHG
jgi:tetratricopeptide (TPR) repeat protein